MKFKSEKNIWLVSFLYLIVLVLTYAIASKLIFEDINFETIIMSIIIFVSDIFILGALLFTHYEIKGNILYWRSGILKGKINIDTINTIEKRKKGMYSGLKPALSEKGLIIKYNKYDEIYISPKTNESFINRILGVNKNVEIK